MRIETSRFGEIDIADEKVLHFPEGIPGLDNLKRYTLISADDTAPFHWLQSVEDGNIALAVVNPFLIIPDYAPMIPESVIQELGIAADEDVLLITVAVIPQEVKNMSTNLAAPIIVNAKTNEGRQVILQDGKYQTRRPIFDLVQSLEVGGEADAGSDT